MRIVLEQSVFQPEREADLLALLLACRAPSPHFVIATPQFAAWSKQWTRVVQRELASLAKGTFESSVRPNAQTIVVHDGVSVWEPSGSEAPRLSLVDALAMVRAPLRVLVENRRNDGRFIARMSVVMTQPQRDFFDDALTRGWVEFEQGGGLSEIERLLEDLSTATDPVLAPSDLLEVRRRRLLVIVDRDARAARQTSPLDAMPVEVDTPSEESIRALEAGNRVLLPWRSRRAAHQLSRRALENYLPLRALRAWIDTAPSGSAKAERRALVDAFAALDSTARARFNMKGGLLNELPKKLRDRFNYDDDTHVHLRFRALDRVQRAALREGFGSRIADALFDRGLTLDEWLRDELAPRAASATAPCEARDIVENIINRV